jgi:hypothetical protein
MAVIQGLWMVGAALCLMAGAPAGAQTVYKCGPRTYSQHPCSRRVVSTDEAPVPVKPNPRQVDVRRLEENRVLARSLRRLPGESAEEFQLRRRRTRLLQTDRDECERLDARIPVEEARAKSPEPAEVTQGQAALAQSRKRFGQLKC